MFWYTVNLLFKSSHSINNDIDSLWEERIILIRANTEKDAREKAILIAKEAEHSYPIKNDKVDNDIVQWSFDRIERIFQLEDDNLKDGTELFSRFLRGSEVKSLLTPFND